MSQRLLEGQQEYIPSADDHRHIQSENNQLRTRIGELEDQLAQVKRDRAVMAAALSGLRTVLDPIHTVMRAVYGEIEILGPIDVPHSTIGSTTVASNELEHKWQSIKLRLQPRYQQVIDVLLHQKFMSRKQIAAAIQMGYNNCVKNVVGPLIRQGWLIETSSGISLKEI